MEKAEMHPEDPRSRILQAARDILERSDVTRFSMRQLIREAGVTNVLLYKTFPSKNMILRELFREQVREFRDEIIDLNSSDEFQYVYDIIEISTRLLYATPGLMRATSVCLFSEAGELRTSVDDTGVALWKMIFTRLVKAKLLRSGTNLNILAHHMLMSNISVVRLLVLEDLPQALYSELMGYNISLACMSYATNASRARFERKLKEYELMLANDMSPHFAGSWQDN